jgi:ApaG protein
MDGRGSLHEVRGQGVVGDMPVIPPGTSYDYVSGCPLDTPEGTMEGNYQLVDEEGNALEADIPRFALLTPSGINK